MIPPIFFILIIDIIYLIGLLIKWKKMPRKPSYEFPLLDFVQIWVLVLLGIIALPNPSIFEKLIYFILASSAVFVFGFFYHIWKRPKKPKVHTQPLMEKPTKQRSDEFHIIIKKATVIDVLSFVVITGELVDIFMFNIAFPLTRWQVFIINNIPVVTYSDLSIIAFFVIGLVLIWDVTRRLRLQWRAWHKE
jgi:hypothetical protein